MGSPEGRSDGPMLREEKISRAVEARRATGPAGKSRRATSRSSAATVNSAMRGLISARLYSRQQSEQPGDAMAGQLEGLPVFSADFRQQSGSWTAQQDPASAEQPRPGLMSSPAKEQ